MFVHEWCPTELVPICLSSRVKTICIRGLHGRPDEMEVTKYLLKHGKVLDMVRVCTSEFHEGEMKFRHEISMCPRGSKTCRV